MTTIQEVQKKAKEKNRVLKSGKKLLNARDDIIDLFEKGIFPYKGIVFKTKEKKSEENNLEKIKDDYKIFFKYIEDESKGIKYDLFKQYFDFEVPTVLAKKLYETKDKKENNDLVESIKIRWSNLKDEIEKMSKGEIENEKPDKILDIIGEILNFDNKI